MLLSNNSFFINEAIKEAKKSPMKNKYGALLIFRNKIISRGYNKFKGKEYISHNIDNIINQKNNCFIMLINSNTFYEPNKYSIHAEQNCISNCKNKNLIKNCDMLLLRISETNDVRPCNMCQHIIDKYNLKKLYTLSINKNNAY